MNLVTQKPHPDFITSETLYQLSYCGKAGKKQGKDIVFLPEILPAAESFFADNITIFKWAPLFLTLCENLMAAQFKIM